LAHVLSQLLGKLVHVDRSQHLSDRFAAHPGDEAFLAVLLQHSLELFFGNELPPYQRRTLGVDHDVTFAVEHLLQILQCDVEKVANSRRKGLEEPDVRDWRGESDVTKPLASDLGLNDFHAALLADHATVLHALVLAAVALVILHWTKNPGAEQ